MTVDGTGRTEGGRFQVVGCGTVVPEPDRACSSCWIETGPTRLLIDCGPGLLQAMARLGLPWHAVTDIAITHFHADHTGALPGLLFSLAYGLLPARRIDPLDVWGPPGTGSFFDAMGRAWGEFVLDPGFEIRLHELPARDAVRLADRVEMRAHPVPHTDWSRALRLEFPGGSVAVTGDTGPSESLAGFCAGADLLVSECSLPDSHAVDTHLSPRSVARLASDASPGLLLLTHVYPQFRRHADVPRLVREAGWSGPVELANEGWEMRFPA